MKKCARSSRRLPKTTDLDDIDRRELLDALEVALERLEEEDISEEEAFAAMSQLSAEIEEIENQARRHD